MKEFITYLCFLLGGYIYAEAQCYKHVTEFQYDDNGNRVARTYHVINPCRNSVMEDDFVQIGHEPDSAHHSFKIFPNPSNGRFTVEILPSNDVLLEDFEILLMDASGRVIYRTPINDYQTFFDIYNMSDGAYIVGILNRSKFIYSNKIVKM